MQLGPDYEKLFLAKRLNKESHEDIIRRYCAFYEGTGNDEVIEYYKELLNKTEAETTEEAPVEEVPVEEVKEEPKKSTKKPTPKK